MADNGWIELTVGFSDVNDEKRDIAIAVLADIGYESFSDSPSGINAYISNSLFSVDTVMASGLFDIPVLSGIEISHRAIERVNWNHEWEKNFEPVIVADRLSVRAPFHPRPQNVDFDIVIEPKMSFGTGHNQTTALMAELLLNQNVKGLKVLDMGCGTGILAILASMKGATEVKAVDIDEWACINTQENCRTNNCSIDVSKGDISSVSGERYHLVMANITRNILIENMNILCSCVKEGGTLFLSGFYSEDLRKITEATGGEGFIPVTVLSKDEWCAAAYDKK
jgi:ribosomal protein L11 methyltransferase